VLQYRKGDQQNKGEEAPNLYRKLEGNTLQKGRGEKDFHSLPSSGQVTETGSSSKIKNNWGATGQLKKVG